MARNSQRLKNGIETIKKNSLVSNIHIENIDEGSNEAIVKLMRIPIKISKIKVNALLDSGASASFISIETFARLNVSDINGTGQKLLEFKNAAGLSMQTRGHFEIKIKILNEEPVAHAFFVLQDMKEAMILGMDFLAKFGVVIDGTKREMTYKTADGPRNVLLQIDFSDVSKDKKKFKAEDLLFPNLTREQENQLHALLREYDHLFATSYADLGKPKGLPTLQILDSNVPVYRKPYTVPITQRPILDKIIEELLKYDIIEESVSPYASPVILVKKKGGNYRMAVDYRLLNRQCVPYPSIIPNLSSAFQQLYGSKWYSCVDMYSGYYQIYLDPSTAFSTTSAFSTPDGHYQFKRVPFGIFSAPAIFCAVMQKILRPVLRKSVIIYMDDLIIYSKTFDEHIQHIEEVFKLLSSYDLRLNLAKCEFAKFRLLFLGFIITNQGMMPNPDKISCINNMLPPKNVDQLKRFLGMTNFFRRFIRSYADRCHPMLKLLKKGVTWVWNKEQIDSFNDIKKELVSSPILRFPKLDKEFIIMCDASQNGLGAVLMQKQDISVPGKEEKEERLVAISYASKSLTATQRRWSTIERESYAAVFAVQTFHEYLKGRRFKIQTDHAPLLKTLQKSDPNKRMGKFAMELRAYKFDVEYKKGSENVLADALSRLEISTDNSVNTVLAINEMNTENEEMVDLPSIEEIIMEQKTDEYCKKIAEELEKDPLATYIDYEKGMLRMNEKIVVPAKLIAIIIQRYHAHPLNSHLGAKKTINRIIMNYTFPKLARRVYDFVISCVICQKRKASKLTSAPLKPYQVFKDRWTMVNADLVGPLHTTYNNNKYILVVSEYLTKYIVAVPLPDKSTKVVANAFVNHVILKHGTMDYLTTDLGNEFESELFREMCKILKIRKLRTVAYKPSTNGKIESFNASLGNMLASILGDDKFTWDVKLPYAVYSYNTSVHEGTKFSPHYLTFGQNVREPEDLWLPPKYRIMNKENEEFLAIWKDSLYEAKENLEQSQLKQKYYFDRNKKLRSFQIGDLILIKEMRVRYKFDDRFLGPYIVLKKLNDRNYVIKRPSKDKELIVNVNRMKLYHSRKPEDIPKQVTNNFRSSEQSADLKERADQPSHLLENDSKILPDESNQTQSSSGAQNRQFPAVAKERSSKGRKKFNDTSSLEPPVQQSNERAGIKRYGLRAKPKQTEKYNAQ